MKITKEQLRQIIKEELEAVQEEGIELPSLRDIGDMITKSPEERSASRKRKAERAAIDHRKLIIMCHEYKQCGKLFAKGYDEDKVAKEYAEMEKYGEIKDTKNDPFSYPSPYKE